MRNWIDTIVDKKAFKNEDPPVIPNVSGYYRRVK